MSQPPRRVLWAWVALGGLLLGTPTLGWAHAVLVRSKPAVRGVLKKAPAQVQLWFNERLEPAFARLSVWRAEGAQVDFGEAEVALDDPTQLSVRLRPLPPGSYVVKYRVLSVDGHVVEGEFSFTLRGP